MIPYGCIILSMKTIPKEMTGKELGRSLEAERAGSRQTPTGRALTSQLKLQRNCVDPVSLQIPRGSCTDMVYISGP